MGRQTFVNLAVKDVARTRAFWTALGFGFDEHFSNDTAIAMRLGDDSFAMLLHTSFFETFLTKPRVDPAEATEVLVALSCDSREEVDRMIATAEANGGREPRPKQDHGFMYAGAFEDLDGHVWEVFWMDPNAVPPQG